MIAPTRPAAPLAAPLAAPFTSFLALLLPVTIPSVIVADPVCGFITLLYAHATNFP